MLLRTGRRITAGWSESTHRIRADAPGSVLVALSVLAAAVLGQVIIAILAHPGADFGSGLLRSGLPVFCAVTGLIAVWWIVHWRSRHSGDERRVWGMLSLALAVFGLSGVITVVFTVVPALDRFVELPVAAGTFVAFPLAFRGAVRWTRRTPGVDPDDLLNGCSSVLVLASLIGCVLTWSGRSADGVLALPRVTWGWGQQVLALQSSAWIILVLTAVTAASISRLYQDVRIWLVTAVYAMAGAGGVAALFHGGALPVWTVLVWSIALLLLALAALLPVRPVPVEAANPVKSTIGAFFVVTVAMTVLVSALLTDVPDSVALFAVAAAMGSSTRLLVNLREIVLLAATRAEARTDELTGTANRRALLTHLQSRLAQGSTTQLVVFDLDHFKEVNDGLGHSAGDDLLRMVAQRLGDRLPAASVLGRLGGDEFAIVSPGEVGDSTLAALEQAFAESFSLEQMTVDIDLSIGVTRWRPDQVGEGDRIDAATLMRQADTAMYDGKRNNLRAVTYDPGRHADPQGLLSMVGELRRALNTGQLRVHYQPQLHTGALRDDFEPADPLDPAGHSGGRLAGVEALVRWEHPRLGLMMPAQFLPLAESHGLMDAVTHDVLAQAVAQQALWRDAGRDIRVSVNLSAGTLLDASLPGTVEALLARHQVPATSLVLEVTETALLREPERSLAVVEALRALGIQVSIDDFGTGYSSLTQLRQLPVRELKLDRSFTVDLLTDPRAAAIVSNTIALAHDLNLRVVAEGVEDEPTLAALARLACDETQGYLHTKPLPPESFDGWLQQHESLRLGAPQALSA